MPDTTTHYETLFIPQMEERRCEGRFHGLVLYSFLKQINQKHQTGLNCSIYSTSTTGTLSVHGLGGALDQTGHAEMGANSRRQRLPWNPN